MSGTATGVCNSSTAHRCFQECVSTMFLDERAHFGRVGRAADQKSRPDRCSSFLQRDAVSETFELGDEVPGEAGRVGTALKVVAAELVVLDVVAQHVVGGDQDRVRDGTIALLWP